MNFIGFFLFLYYLRFFVKNIIKNNLLLCIIYSIYDRLIFIYCISLLFFDVISWFYIIIIIVLIKNFYDVKVM